MLTLTWAGPSTLLAAGHNCVPIAFTVDGGTGSLGQGVRGRLNLIIVLILHLFHLYSLRLEDDKKAVSSGTSSAMRMFMDKNKLGSTDTVSKLNTTHQNQVRLPLPLSSCSCPSPRCVSSVTTKVTRPTLAPLARWLETADWFSGTWWLSR